MKNGISLCIIAKNEEGHIHLPIESVKDHVNEIVLMDDFSTDNTVAIAEALGAKIYKYDTPILEIGFGEALTRGARSVSFEWVLFLDADEILSEPHLLHPLTRSLEKTVWALPRRKWLNYEEGIREEYEAYPDWQPKFFRADTGINGFTGEMHARFVGEKIHYAYRGPHIEHLQNELRTEKKLKHRVELYKHLAAKQRVEVVGGKDKVGR